MSRATPRTREMAQRLITGETRGKNSLRNNPPTAFAVCARLRPYLATLMGSTGFHALLSRALAVASAEDPRLCTVQVKADGSLEMASEDLANPEELAGAGVVLVSQLLGLLMAFVGEQLTVRIIRELWPHLSRGSR